MRRVLVLGGPGSGKSRLARRLGERLDVPVIHVDRLHHLPGWQPRPREAFRAALDAAAAGPAWVIDGNYLSSIGPRLAAADTMIVLDAPRWLRLARVLRRIVVGYGQQRPDSADGCRERFDAAFLSYVWHWQRDVAPRVETVAAAFTGRLVRLPSRRAIAAFLAATPAGEPLAPPTTRS